jgi:hypothetical protein
VLEANGAALSRYAPGRMHSTETGAGAIAAHVAGAAGAGM